MKAVIFFGAPGSGKGTQAELLMRSGEYIHFDTGHYLEGLLHRKEIDKNSILKKERELWDSGKLNTPSWVLSIVKKATQKIRKAEFGVVYSGSPRTLFEAFGENKTHGLIDELENLYKKENIIIIHLIIPLAISSKRNAARFICSVCGLPRLAGAHHTSECVFCGGKLKKRILDDPRIIKTRVKEYGARTAPIFKKLKEEGYTIHNINATPAPFKIMEKVKKIIG